MVYLKFYHIRICFSSMELQFRGPAPPFFPAEGRFSARNATQRPAAMQFHKNAAKNAENYKHFPRFLL